QSRGRSACMFYLLPAACREYPLRRSRGEAFRSAEARPLAADWPLRAGLNCLLHLEAPDLSSQASSTPGPGGGHPRPRPFNTFTEASCCQSPRPPRHSPPARPCASASASTPRATATTPPSCARTSSPPPPSCSSPSPATATPSSASASSTSRPATPPS